MNKTVFEVSGISWERIFLTFDIQTDYRGKVSFRLERMGKIIQNEQKNVDNIQMKIIEKLPIEYESETNGKYHFRFNMSSMNDNAFLNNGRWRIVAQTEKRDFVCVITYKEGILLDDHSRIFRYGGDKYAYNVSLGFQEEKDGCCFLIHSYFMIWNSHWKTRRYVQEALTVKGKFNRIQMYMAIVLMRMYYFVWAHIFPKRGKNILLMSETKDYLWGNLKAIDDRLRERGLDKEFHISYSFRKAVGNHKSVFSWVKLVFTMAKQDYIFVDDYVPVLGFLKLCKKTKLIQVWHAGVGFKSVGYSRFGKNGTPFPSGSCHKQYDYVLVGAPKLIDVYSEVFGLPKDRFLPVGMPRLDGFLDATKIRSFKNSFYKEYPKLKGKKIILFAPTFRGGGQKDAYYDSSWLDLKEIYEFCKEEYMFLIKMHPFVDEPIRIPDEYKNRIVDFSSYPNINDLYYVTEILITDYSSNYYEYSLMERPIIFYTPDLENYELSRGVHRSVKESAPGKVCETFEEMMHTLYNGDYEIEKVHQFVKDNFDGYDGHATDKIIEAILLK